MKVIVFLLSVGFFGVIAGAGLRDGFWSGNQVVSYIVGDQCSGMIVTCNWNCTFGPDDDIECYRQECTSTAILSCVT
jgi:hypothetical protein